MNSENIIVSLDIGTSKVRVIIGELSEGSLNIVGVGSADSQGIRKGAIVDIDQTVDSIRKAVDYAERMVGIQISDVYVGVVGNHIELQSSHGVVAVSNEDREIRDDDIERVLNAAKVFAMPPEREIIGIVPEQFLVDGLEGIQEPRGMIGVRLEVEAQIITGAKTTIHNLLRCVEKADLTISGLVLMPMAAAQLALSKDEKMLGTILVDIGAGATTLSLFQDGNIKTTSTVPIGGDFITNDISIGLRVNTEAAERIKLKYGCAVLEDAAEDQTFKVANIGSEDNEREYSQVDLAEIIEPRVREIFQLIGEEAARLGMVEPAGGYVLSGGPVSMPGMLQIAREELGTAVRITIPDYIGVRDPAYTNGVGIIQYSSKYIKGHSVPAPTKKSKVQTSSDKPRIFERLKNWFSEFI